MYAVRNIRLCTKDCLCLYVCPTGATDTENGQVDASKCIGCGVCANACPSHAISMVPDTIPPQQPKTDGVIKTLYELAGSKAVQEQIATQLKENSGHPVAIQLAQAIETSNRLMAEDILREAGYMLPQSANAENLLKAMLEHPAEDFPVEAAEQLLKMLKFNEKAEEEKVEQWKCTVCGYIHEGPLPEGFICPVCKQPASKFIKL